MDPRILLFLPLSLCWAAPFSPTAACAAPTASAAEAQTGTPTAPPRERDKAERDKAEREKAEREKAESEKQDARARAAFAGLTQSEKKDVVDFLTLEAGHLGTFQGSLVAWVVKHQDRDPAAWKVAEEAPFFDPVQHAPAQPTPRVRLDPALDVVKSTAALIFGQVRPRRLVPGFRYDYATRELLRVPAPDERQRVFDNALAGYPPDLDLAEALVERALDDGAHELEAQAFAHAYTDRSGHVYPGITLYDAYASPAEFEMPDVDVLGLVHTLMPGVTTWTAPIPGQQHEVVYEKIGQRFTALYRHRSLRHALACTFLVGSETLRDNYQGNLDNFHALWEDCQSKPEALVLRLPTSAGRDAFLEAWVKRCHEPGSPYERGRRRRATLDSDGQAVRTCVFRVLDEYGVLPAAPPSSKDTPPNPR